MPVTQTLLYSVNDMLSPIDTTKEVQICLRAKKDHLNILHTRLEKFSCVSTENSLKLN